jgi:hypothetical protein
MLRGRKGGMEGGRDGGVDVGIGGIPFGLLFKR